MLKSNGASAALPQQIQVEPLSGPQLITHPIEEKKQPRFLPGALSDFFIKLHFTVVWVDSTQGLMHLTTPEYQIADGWQKGAYERVTFELRAEEIKINQQLRYKIYLRRIRVERRGGYRPRWHNVASLAGDDPELSLVQELQKQFVLQ